MSILFFLKIFYVGFLLKQLRLTLNLFFNFFKNLNSKTILKHLVKNCEQILQGLRAEIFNYSIIGLALFENSVDNYIHVTDEKVFFHFLINIHFSCL